MNIFHLIAYLTLTLYQLQLPFNINHMCESYEDPIFHSRFIGKTFFHNYMFDRDLMTVILAYLQPLININNMCKFPEDSTYCSRVIWKTFLLIIACLTLIVTLWPWPLVNVNVTQTSIIYVNDVRSIYSYPLFERSGRGEFKIGTWNYNRIVCFQKVQFFIFFSRWPEAILNICLNLISEMKSKSPKHFGNILFISYYNKD